MKEFSLQKLQQIANPQEGKTNFSNPTIKFSYSNENELMAFSGKNKETSRTSINSSASPMNKTNIFIFKKLRSKSKSEEKFSNSPNYQIFMAKTPEIRQNLLKFIDKKFHNKLNSQLNSPIASLEEIAEFKTEKKNSFSKGAASQKKILKTFKEDDKLFFNFNNPSVYYLGPVLEEKKRRFFFRFLK